MRVDFFTIPALDPEPSTGDLNKLLASARILTVDRQFVADGSKSFWSICVTSQTGPGKLTDPDRKPKVDYKEILSAEDFAVFARLREWRKEIATRDGVTTYAVFTNDQLSEIARRRVSSKAALKEIAGIGASRVEKYGIGIVALVQSLVFPPEGGDAT